MQHATEAFQESTYHRELGNFLVESCAKEEMTDQAIIKELALRTKNLLSKLETLKEEGGYVTMEAIHRAKVKPPFDKFLYNLAIAEEIAMPQKPDDAAAATPTSQPATAST
eukprot:TRINITY_DN530_c0_g1_i3.p2 TRINITY_DN530_c0_g1~~TRINITY_DN530_c0_g1_i3.p2  ORF type:complete len:111 (+),score=34.34 TRINITY_DN530_c0_g1_i3:229-561(+)